MLQSASQIGRWVTGLRQKSLVLISTLCTCALMSGWGLAGDLSDHGAELPQLEIQLGHSNTISSAVFSSDDRFILTASADKTARLWDRATGSELRRFEGHSDQVSSAVFSPDDRFILTASKDKTARLWDVRTGLETCRFEGHSDGLSSAVFSPDGRAILTTSWDKTARLWDRITKKELQSFKGHKYMVISAVFSRDGRAILTASADGTARLWDVATGKELNVFRGFEKRVTSAVFSPDGRFILIASRDKTVRLLDAASGRRVRDFKGHGDAVNSAVFSPGDGRFILTASWDKTARLWDTASGRRVHLFPLHENGLASAVFSSDGRLFLTTSTDGPTRLWDIVTGQELRRFEGHGDAVTSAVFSPDGRFIMTASWDKMVRLWDTASGQQLRSFEGHGNRVVSAVFSPDGRAIITASADKTARLWDVASAKELRPPFKGHGDGVTSAAFSPDDGRFILTASWDKTARLWDRVTGHQLGRPFEGHGDGVTSAAFSPDDGRFILTASGDKTARLWDRASGHQLGRPFEGHGGRVSSAVFSPGDSRFILTASEDKTARLWDRASGHQLGRPFEGHGDGVTSAVFSPGDDRFILTASWDKTARLWDRVSGHQLGRPFEGHGDGVTSAEFSPDGQFVLTASRDRTTRLWNRDTGQEQARLISFADGTWVVTTPEGRFDTNNLEEIKGLHWLMPDDPLRALPLEIFMRDYYKPKLLPRVLASEKLPAVRSLTELNRAQPKVLGIEVVPRTGGDRVDVTVEVAGGEYENATTGKKHSSSVHDLRLFRDGQLVGQWPEPKASTPDGVSGAELMQWQADTQVVPANGSTTVTFRGIRVPHRGTEAAVEFSAYAFNEDRVKGETTRTTTPAATGAVTKRAYLVAIGVDDYGDDRWNLRYATKDARAMVQALEPRLKHAGYEPQITVLGSDADQKRPNKDSIRAALEGLAGVSTPDDLVILFFSGHGYSGEQGAFYLLPEDSQPSTEPNWRRPAQASLARTISAEELSRWVRRVDAAELVLILDACHSAASVEGAGFQPGPLGSKGLGQLAYDKRMRVLAASQSDQAAREMGGQIGAGMLTYTLVHDALQAKQAADEHGTITLTRWLEYPVTRVPQLFEELRMGTVNDYGVVVTKDAIPPQVQGVLTQKGAVQVPALFDYTRGVQAGVGLEGASGVSQ